MPWEGNTKNRKLFLSFITHTITICTIVNIISRFIFSIGTFPFILQSLEEVKGIPKWELVLASSSELERDSWVDVIKECSRRSISGNSLNGRV